MIDMRLKYNASRSAIGWRRYVLVAVLTLVAGMPASINADQVNARDIIKGAMDNWRGVSSYSEMTMTIHRPEWTRAMSMRAWTEGEKKSLVRVTEPIKDAGNSTLIDDKQMWSYAPKINRVIKVPSSMMSQSWMGSDFSNKDISRSTEILDSYDHSLTAVEQRDGHDVYTVTSIPHEEAPVVWGKEVLQIRDDYVLLEQQYWDQDGELVKIMKTGDIAEMDGRMFATTLRMYEVETPDEWTEVVHHTVEFDVKLPSNIFTLSNLRNPRQ
ncbi:MAG: outer membrane lipoprotein-sorting protein [Arenicella sp.]|nr:outer membrane lipoprotein-sorting protein [Arenicella sp.]